MGVVHFQEETYDELVQELRRISVSSAGLRKDQDQLKQKHFSFTSNQEQKLVCVTSGVSFLGLAVVRRLLLRGYSVRIIITNAEDIEKLREMTLTVGNSNMNVVEAKLTDVESLSQAFHGCRGVFHTSGFTDPAGLSGYTKSMAEIEVKGSENVMRACALTASVRKCVFTSSLLACLWQEQDIIQQQSFPTINHDSWSNESLCTDKKLWYALGKLRAEKAAWTIAKENGLELTTICPGLITGPEFCTKNPTATIAYLKGAQEMYHCGVLATVDVMKLADAHVSVYEAMNKTTFGRYICFDKVIETEEEAEKLAEDTNLPKNKICGNIGASNVNHLRFQLSNRKLASLLPRTMASCFNQSQKFY